MRLSDIGLQRRIMLYVAVGLLGLISLLAYVALRSATQSSEAAQRERLVLSRTVAQAVDQAIAASTILVTRLADSSADELGDPQAAGEALETLARALADINSGTPPELLVLLRDDGQPVSMVRGGEEGQAVLTYLTILDPMDTPTVIGGGAGGPYVAIVARLPGADPATRLAAVILPSPDLLRVPDVALGGARSYHTELVDEQGNVLETSAGEGTLEPSRHMEVLGEYVGARVSGVSTHSVSGGDGSSEAHIVAFAPLSQMPWGVIVEQPEDVALALPTALRRRILFISAGAFVAALALAWGTSYQVVRPLTRLTENARRIAGGDLGSAVIPGGQDEIRRLGESFETMRARLEESQRQLAIWSSELEDRVRDRTAQLEQRNREREVLLGKVMTAQEEERKRIARDLHDQVGQALTSLTMRLGSAETALGERDPETAEQLAVLRQAASDTIEEVRRLIGDLRPSILDDMGLAAAVGWYLESHLERAGVNTSLEVTGFNGKLPARVEITAFRVVQEAVNNIMKHASARNATVTLVRTDADVEGEVRDDGSGFDVSLVVPALAGNRAVGLLGMRERVNLIGGSMRIQSESGEGTVVSFRIPLDEGGGVG